MSFLLYLAPYVTEISIVRWKPSKSLSDILKAASFYKSRQIIQHLIGQLCQNSDFPAQDKGAKLNFEISWLPRKGGKYKKIYDKID